MPSIFLGNHLNIEDIDFTEFEDCKTSFEVFEKMGNLGLIKCWKTREIKNDGNTWEIAEIHCYDGFCFDNIYNIIIKLFDIKRTAYMIVSDISS